MLYFLYKIVLLTVFINQATSADPYRHFEFLTQLLNCSKENIYKAANTFKFLSSVENDVTFWCILPTNKTVPFTRDNFTNVIDTRKPTKFLIHGWINNGTAPFIIEMANRLHAFQDCNVISVDWKKWASENYFVAASAVQAVGYLSAGMIVEMYVENRNFLDNVHILGHSLGAHAAGFAGKKVKSWLNNCLDRITALDVAAPLFEFPFLRTEKFRLASSDAKFVDVIHTNIGLFGVHRSYGTCDFFVNGGGPFQPFCRDSDVFTNAGCSHMTSHEYYTQSIDHPEMYESYSCTGYILFIGGWCQNNKRNTLGGHVGRNASGNYYLDIEKAFEKKFLQ